MEPETKRILGDGLLAGLVGYVTVVVLFAIANLVAGRSPFHTAALLGSALFYGLDDPTTLDVVAGPVAAYNMAHALAFLGLGLFLSWLVSMAERFPVARYLVLFALIFIAAHTYTALLLFAFPLLDHAALQIGLATVAAAIAMGSVLLARHPGLRHGLTTTPMGEE